VFYFGGIISGTLTLAPIFFTCLTLPIVEKINKGKKFQKLFLTFLLLVTLGILSSTFYLGIIKNVEDKDHMELPDVLKILLSLPPGESVYTPSYYTYFVWRLAEMSHLNVTQEPHNASIILVDNRYVEPATIESLSSNEKYKAVYNGVQFCLFIRGSEY
jgi:uncharacterized protein with PQ loop repeat